MHFERVGISFDSSKLAAMTRWDDREDSQWDPRYISVWDLPNGTLLYSLECKHGHLFQWSWTDQYFRLEPRWYENFRYLNTETFQEEVLEHPGDRFHGPNHLHRKGNIVRIRLSSGRVGPLFSAIPSHLRIKEFRSRGDRACILSSDRRVLLNTSGLGTYMENCNLQFEPEVSRIKLC